MSGDMNGIPVSRNLPPPPSSRPKIIGQGSAVFKGITGNKTVNQNKERATTLEKQTAKMATIGGNQSSNPRTASVRPAPPKLAKNQLPPPPSSKPTKSVAGQTQATTVGKMMDEKPTLPPPPRPQQSTQPITEQTAQEIIAGMPNPPKTENKNAVQQPQPSTSEKPDIDFLKEDHTKKYWGGEFVNKMNNNLELLGKDTTQYSIDVLIAINNISIALKPIVTHLLLERTPPYSDENIENFLKQLDNTKLEKLKTMLKKDSFDQKDKKIYKKLLNEAKKIIKENKDHNTVKKHKSEKNSNIFARILHFKSKPQPSTPEKPNIDLLKSMDNFSNAGNGLQILNNLILLKEDTNKHPIDDLIAISKKNYLSYHYIVDHLVLQRNEPYSTTDIVKFLNSINISLLSNDNLNKLKTYLEGKKLDLNLVDQKTLTEFAKNIQSAKNTASNTNNTVRREIFEWIGKDIPKEIGSVTEEAQAQEMMNKRPNPPTVPQKIQTENAFQQQPTNLAPQPSIHEKQKVEPFKGDHQENQDILPMETLIEKLNTLNKTLKNGQPIFTGTKEISKTIKNLKEDITKYSINKLITIAEKDKGSWDYIIDHLFLNRNDRYSATEIVTFLNSIDVSLLSNNGVDLLKKLTDKENKLDWSSVPENLLTNFAGNINFAQSSRRNDKEGLRLIQDLTNNIKEKSRYPESFNINIKTKKHNFFTKLFRRH